MRSYQSRKFSSPLILHKKKNSAEDKLVDFASDVPVLSDMSQIYAIIRIWSCIPQKNEHFEDDSPFEVGVLFQNLEKPFKKVSYSDQLGICHKHWVHSRQVPLPQVLASGVEENVLRVLNNQDYRIDLSKSEVIKELTQNTVLANTNLNLNENLNFFPVKEIIREGKVKQLVQSLNGQVPVYYRFEKEAGLAYSKGLRDEMEDEHLVAEFKVLLNACNESVKCYAIFDGHGGRGCAEYVRNHFVSCFGKWMNEPSFAFFQNDVKIFNALNLTFADLNHSFCGYSEGTTAILCMIIQNELWVANLGDSRAILVLPDETIQLSEDQKPKQAEHRCFIEGRGAVVTENGKIIHPLSPYIIAPGRGLGDHHLKGGIYPRPVISKVSRLNEKKGGLLVLGCDGVFDVVSTSQIGEFVCEERQLGKSRLQIAVDIAASALFSGSTDNVSVLVVPV